MMMMKSSCCYYYSFVISLYATRFGYAIHKKMCGTVNEEYQRQSFFSLFRKCYRNQLEESFSEMTKLVTHLIIKLTFFRLLSAFFLLVEEAN